jgi:aminoglycoside phosphotransferase family enzyme
MLKLGGAGRACDWLVKMRRLPASLMLDNMLAQRKVDAPQIRNIAQVLADFYAGSDPVEISAVEYRQRFHRTISAQRDELSSPAYHLPGQLVTTTCDAQLTFLDRYATLFDECVWQGRVIEAHGDLRPEHICLETKPCIIDCLQFKRDLRLMDWLDDCAFLALECERLGAPAVGRDLVATIGTLVQARNPRQATCHPALLDFYMSYRAAIRAKLAARHLDDHGVRNPQHWRQRAAEYLRLASAHSEAAISGSRV